MNDFYWMLINWMLLWLLNLQKLKWLTQSASSKDLHLLLWVVTAVGEVLGRTLVVGGQLRHLLHGDTTARRTLQHALHGRLVRPTRHDERQHPGAARVRVDAHLRQAPHRRYPCHIRHSYLQHYLDTMLKYSNMLFKYQPTVFEMVRGNH